MFNAKVALLAAIACFGCAQHPQSKVVIELDPHTPLSEVQRELREGADPNQRSDTGQPLIVQALGLLRPDIAEALVAAGARVDAANRFGQTALQGAAWGGYEIGVKLLLDHGANVNLADKYGQTPLQRAIATETFYPKLHERYDATIRLLISHGATYYAGKSSLGPARFWGFGNHLDYEFLKYADASLINLALSRGACVSSLLSYRGEELHKSTPLHLASAFNRADLVKLFLSHGAPVDQRASTGQTPLIIAAEDGSVECMGILLAHGANIEARDTGDADPLLWAISRAQIPAEEFLLAHGANPNEKYSDGESALQRAQKYDDEHPSEEIVKAIWILKQHGAKG